MADRSSTKLYTILKMIINIIYIYIFVLVTYGKTDIYYIQNNTKHDTRNNIIFKDTYAIK